MQIRHVAPPPAPRAAVLPFGSTSPLRVAYPLRMRRAYALISCVLLLTGCAEHVLIRSYPAGAKAIVDGYAIGTTPATTSIPRGDVSKPHTWRVEYRNCDAAEGTLQTGVAGGRIAGYIFTLGILAIFRGPYYFRPVDAMLTGGDCEGRPAAATQPGIVVQQIVGDHNVAPAGARTSNTQKLAERLETLRDLYNRKLITKAVYESESQKAVREYTSEPGTH